MVKQGKLNGTGSSVALNCLIAGGGIGGLTTALCLHHFGHKVSMFEQSDEISEVGAGLQISPNGMKVFEKLGLADALLQKGFQPEALEMRQGQTGHTIFTIPLDHAALKRWGAPYLHIHRADLVEVLKTALIKRAPDSLHIGKTVSGYSQAGNSVTVSLKNGSPCTGDVLVGCDGIHSTIRRQMLGPGSARFTGCVAWRATVPIDRLGDLAPPPTASVWVGPGRHAVTYRLRAGELANLVAVVERDDWTSESWSERGTRKAALADFEGWHPIITNLINQAEDHFLWALYDRPALPRWSDGRVALLGDACHPMLPFAAQGAVMAIEDSWVLAQALSKAPDTPSQALKSYFSQRIHRATSVQKQGWANMRTFHRRSPLMQIATYAPMQMVGRFAPGLIRANRDKLYGYDVTAT